MRYLLLLLPLFLAGCYDPYYPYGGYAYAGYAPGYQPGYYNPNSTPPTYGGQMRYYGGPPPVYPSQQPYYGGPGAYSPQNCGTPDQPKPCYR